MSLVDQINNDLKEAMKAKQQERLDTLRFVRAEILKKEKEKVGTKVDDEMLLAILKTLVKQRQDSVEQYTNGNRLDLAAKEQAELDIIKSYLPAALSQDEVIGIIDAAIKESGAASPAEVGKAMGLVMKKLKETGKSFDGKAVNGLVKSRLGG